MRPEDTEQYLLIPIIRAGGDICASEHVYPSTSKFREEAAIPFNTQYPSLLDCLRLICLLNLDST